MCLHIHAKFCGDWPQRDLKGGGHQIDRCKFLYSLLCCAKFHLSPICYSIGRGIDPKGGGGQTLFCPPPPNNFLQLEKLICNARIGLKSTIMDYRNHSI